MIWLALILVLALAAANGANDNAKGVATLLGAGVMNYRGALALATAATALGALASIMLAGKLLAAFGGRGLVPDEIARAPAFYCAVAAAAAATVGLAARIGAPISTTHALLGALIGAGLVAAPGQLHFATLGQQFVLPLAGSPLLAMALALPAIPLIARFGKRVAAAPAPCVCEQIALQSGMGAAAATSMLVIGTETTCAAVAAQPLVSVAPRRALDALHYLSAAAVGFARGLNDTPKMAALLVLAGVAAAPAALATALAMSLGGWFGARRVARTMAERITRMDPEQGLSANLVTSALVVGASQLGLPVSTTHVSCGALFGLAASSGRGRLDTVVGILLAWVVTLPFAALLGAGVYFTLTRVP